MFSSIISIIIIIQDNALVAVAALFSIHYNIIYSSQSVPLPVPEINIVISSLLSSSPYSASVICLIQSELLLNFRN